MRKQSSLVPTSPQKFATTAMFKCFVKQNNDSDRTVGMSTIFYYTTLHLSDNGCNGLWVVSIKQNINYNIQPPSKFVLLVYHKNDLIKSLSSFEDVSAYNISWSHVNCCKFYIHIESLNVRHMEVVKVTGLKRAASRSASVAGPQYWMP
jgi:hypothetical protein